MVPNEFWLAGKVNVIEHGSTNLVLLLLENLEKRLTQPYSQPSVNPSENFEASGVCS